MDLSESWETVVNETSSVNESLLHYTDEDYDEEIVLLCDDVDALGEVTACCFLVIFLLSVTVVVSRWVAVPRRRLRFAWAACTASWVVSLAASLSDVISSRVQEVENGTRMFTCEVSPGTSDEEKLGYYLQVSLLFILPLIIIILCYSAILRTVLVTATRRRHRTVLVVFCIVVAFFVCWAPYNLTIFLLSVYTDCEVTKRLYVVYVVCRILAYAHCFLNPALYMLSHSFRQHLWSLLCCLIGEERGGQGGEGERSLGHSTSHVTPRPRGPAVVLQDPRENNYTATWLEIRSLQE
ncbi:unnamed protein product [Coregonus sp. 'balchen']|nr:unnamed protein product [Coregonus sp. 'balchen']